MGREGAGAREEAETVAVGSTAMGSTATKRSVFEPLHEMLGILYQMDSKVTGLSAVLLALSTKIPILEHEAIG